MDTLYPNDSHEIAGQDGNAGPETKNLFSSIYRIRLFCLTEIVFRYFYLLFGLVDVLFFITPTKSNVEKTTDLTF